MGQIGRRRFLLLGGATLALPRLGWGQAKARRVRIAILEDGTKGDLAAQWQEFRTRLREFGWVEGKNVSYIARYSQGARGRLPTFATELVQSAPDVIVAVTTPATRAAMRATSTIPIVFITGDPIGAGLVSSLARPGGNATGQSIMAVEVTSKWLEFLTEVVPGTKKVAMLGQASNRSVASVFRSFQDAAASRNISVRLLEATQSSEVASAFEAMAREHYDGFVVVTTPIVLRNSRQIVELAARYRLPGVYARDDYVKIGGFLSYAPDSTAIFRGTAEQVQRVLTGENPGDLPVEQPTKFRLTINLKRAKALGLTIPPSILVRADRVLQ